MSYDVSFDSAKVESVIKSMDTTYTSISESIKKISEDSSNLDAYWSCDEAAAFKEQLAIVNENLSKFQTKYADFMDLLSKVYSLYGQSSSEFIATLNSIVAARRAGDTHE